LAEKMKNYICALFAVLMLAACTTYQPKELTPEEHAVLENNGVCAAIFAPISSPADCQQDPRGYAAFLKTYVSSGKASPLELCKIVGYIPDESSVHKAIARRKINCPNEFAQQARYEAQANEKYNRNLVKTQSNASLCEMWADDRATQIISLVDQEVKRRGVNCMAYEELAQQQRLIQQQQAYQAQMIQMQQDANRQQAFQDLGTALIRNSAPPPMQPMPPPPPLPPPPTQTNCYQSGNQFNCTTY
jgi:hypothetical protein